MAVLVVAFGHEGVAGTLRLCVSEVVTNAYLYTRADLITVDVSLGSTGVTVWVNDDRPERLPRPPRTAPSWRSEYGRGLLLLSRLADRWDVRATGPRSKHFEFTIDYKGAA